MNPFRSLAVLLLGPFAAVAAQDQATTLLAACRQADVIVDATVAQTTDPSPDWHRLQFTTAAQLKGSPLSTFTLLEPAGPCCGRALFTLQVGDRRLLFLRRVGTTLHVFGGDRGVLSATPDVLAHVLALLAAPDDAAVANLLVQSLTAASPRVGDDAAHALATLPQLALSPGARSLVASALAEAVAARSARTAALVDVAVRQHDAGLLDTLLPAYLHTHAADQAALLRRGLARCAASSVTERLVLHLGDDDEGKVRAAELLAALPPTFAVAPLRQLLRGTDCPRVQLAVAEGLLANGIAAASLAADLPEPVLDLASRRQAGRRRFRTIDPFRP